MDASVMEIIFTFIGGLGIFLYGIKQMGDGLQEAAGDRLRRILNTFTSNPIMGVLTGMLVTILWDNGYYDSPCNSRLYDNASSDRCCNGG